MAIYYGDGSNSNIGRVVYMTEVGYESRWFVNSPSGSWHNGPGNLGSDTACGVTCAKAANKVLLTATLNMGGVDTWTQATARIITRQGTSGSWQTLYGGGQITYLSGRNGAHSTISIKILHHPNSTSTQYYKLQFTSMNSGNYLRLNYGNVGSGADTTSEQHPRSTLVAEERSFT
tara:strand:+ start:33 stop:557 length:525 start_codon:yes stop_codon:yes gene_type:complete